MRMNSSRSPAPRWALWETTTRKRRISKTPQALTRLAVANAIILGHSWGASVAVSLALKYPDMVRGLVLASGYYYPTARPDVIAMGAPALPLVALGIFARDEDSEVAEGRRMSLDMLGVFAEFETNMRKERQMEGIAKAKAAGVYKAVRRPLIAPRMRRSRPRAGDRLRSPASSILVARRSTGLWRDRPCGSCCKP
jgi:pimeloyl-ACP methyl ester carboxylesterase